MWWNGRHDRFRTYCPKDMEVRLLSSAPIMNNKLTDNPFLKGVPDIRMPAHSTPFSEETRLETNIPQKPQEALKTTLEINNSWKSLLNAKESVLLLGLNGQKDIKFGAKESTFQVKEVLNTPEEVKIEFIEQTREIVIVPEPEEEKSGGWVEAIVEETLPIAQKATPKLFSGLFGALGAIFELFLGKTIGLEFASEKSTAKPKKEEKQGAEGDKEKEKKPKFAPGSLVFTPRIQVPMEEISYTDKMNEFHESYMGVLDLEGKISTYHRANRERKELESQAAQIANERALKIKSGRGKTPSGFNPREGELLMGTENPSHFTKALG